MLILSHYETVALGILDRDHLGRWWHRLDYSTTSLRLLINTLLPEYISDQKDLNAPRNELKTGAAVPASITRPV